MRHLYKALCGFMQYRWFMQSNPIPIQLKHGAFIPCGRHSWRAQVSGSGKHRPQEGFPSPGCPLIPTICAPRVLLAPAYPSRGQLPLPRPDL